MIHILIWLIRYRKVQVVCAPVYIYIYELGWVERLSWMMVGKGLSSRGLWSPEEEAGPVCLYYNLSRTAFQTGGGEYRAIPLPLPTSYILLAISQPTPPHPFSPPPSSNHHHNIVFQSLFHFSYRLHIKFSLLIFFFTFCHPGSILYFFVFIHFHLLLLLLILFPKHFFLAKYDFGTFHFGLYLDRVSSFLYPCFYESLSLSPLSRTLR